ncbi:MAG: Mur ligase family protein, partial [Rhodoferax sp.]|nr:Mur ligase family protein [Rhodoferax sp.]
MHATLEMRLGRIQDAIGWRVRKVLGDQLVDRSIVKLARGWRPFLKRPVFVGITGSAGKTTTKELLLGILSHKRRGSANPASLNVLPEVAKTVLRVRPTHDFCVAELSEDQPGAMQEILDLVQPSIGIVTVVQDDHLSAFASRDHLAAEMG